MPVVGVRHRGVVDERVLHLTRRLLAKKALSDLQRVIRQPVLPRFVVVADDLGVDGNVPATWDSDDGLMKDISEPNIRATVDTGLLRYALVHELAHYHELTTRRARRISFRTREGTELWSEYFAQRVCWACGVVPKGLGGGRFAQPESLEESAAGERRPGASFAKMLTWVLAHADVDASWVETYSEDTRGFLTEMISTLQGAGVLSGEFSTFPRWAEGQAGDLDTVYSSLVKTSASLEAGEFAE